MDTRYNNLCTELKKAINLCNIKCPEDNVTVVTFKTDLPISRPLCKYYIKTFIDFHCSNSGK